jgi:Sulfotransferase domain
MALSIPSKALYALGIRSTKSLNLPDFMIIGAPKAGTTWLAENLDCHPQVHLARRPGTTDPTELRYFNQSFWRPLTYYSDLFAAGGRDKIKGDKTPGYCTISPFRIRMIRSIMPDLRLFFFMRHPVERAWSHAVMNLVKIDGRKLEDVPPSRFYKFFVGNREQGLYSRILDRWLEHFPDKQVYTGFYDEIATDPLTVLRSACEHIGARTDVDWNQFPYRSVVNKGERLSMPAEYRQFLDDMFREEIARLDQRLGHRVSRWRTTLAAAHSLLLAALGLAISFADSFDDLADLLDLVV